MALSANDPGLRHIMVDDLVTGRRPLRDSDFSGGDGGTPTRVNFPACFAFLPCNELLNNAFTAAGGFPWVGVGQGLADGLTDALYPDNTTGAWAIDAGNASVVNGLYVTDDGVTDHIMGGAGTQYKVRGVPTGKGISILITAAYRNGSVQAPAEFKIQNEAGEAILWDPGLNTVDWYGDGGLTQLTISSATAANTASTDYNLTMAAELPSAGNGKVYWRVNGTTQSATGAVGTSGWSEDKFAFSLPLIDNARCYGLGIFFFRSGTLPADWEDAVTWMTANWRLGNKLLYPRWIGLSK